MAKDRLRITLDFNANKLEDLKLYEILLRYSSPSNYIKDCIRGLIELPKEYRNLNLVVEENEDDVMDF